MGFQKVLFITHPRTGYEDCPLCGHAMITAYYIGDELAMHVPDDYNRFDQGNHEEYRIISCQDPYFIVADFYR
jgi:hypothetical protein